MTALAIVLFILFALSMLCNCALFSTAKTLKAELVKKYGYDKRNFTSDNNANEHA